MTERLFTADDIAAILGVTRPWIHKHRTGYLEAQFVTTRKGKETRLWTSDGVDRWRVYHAGSVPVSGTWRYGGAYSTHRAVNKVGRFEITWKLWWRSTPGGGTQWWFSTPRGWYTSIDDGRTWESTGLMVRPPDYRYISVVGGRGMTIPVLRTCENLRMRIEDTCQLVGQSSS